MIADGMSPSSPAPHTPAVPSAPLTPGALGATYVRVTETVPLLMVTVDTEEEFDWFAPLSRGGTSVEAMRAVERGQRIFDRFRVRPTYVIDYPVATQPTGYNPLVAFAREDRGQIGAHLHPWVTPPFDEPVDRFHSYGCNLSPAVERAKMLRLRDAIAERTGFMPTVYKAGRYGLGAQTVQSLLELGFDTDVSINPTLPPSADGGPSFQAFDSRPFILGGGRLLELPCTHGYQGWAGPLMPSLHTVASSPIGEAIKAPGVLARLRAVNRIMLSPEGSTLDEMIRLTRQLVGQGLRVFSLTFHSPSLDVGHTPYVRSQEQLQQFLRTIEAYCEYFFGELRGLASTPADFRAKFVAGQVHDA